MTDENDITVVKTVQEPWPWVSILVVDGPDPAPVRTETEVEFHVVEQGEDDEGES